MERIAEFLKETGVFFYATTDGTRPYVRPFGFNMVYEGKFYIGMGTHKESYAQTVANPQVELCACKGPKWMRLRGRAVLDMRPEVQKAMFEKSPFLKTLYNEETGRVHATFRIEDGYCEFNDMRGGFESFRF